MAGRRKSVTLRDVAAVAGVSPPTVSRVLNGGGNVSAETRERIHEAARRLNFHPNALARSFANGRSQTVGVLMQRAANALSQQVLVGASREFGSRQLAVLLYDAGLRATVLDEVLSQLNARRIDGLLVIGSGFTGDLHSVTERLDFPVVYAFGRTDVAEDTVVLPDEFEGGRRAAQHLIEIGRRRIAHITGPPGSGTGRRTQGFLTQMEESGLEPVAFPDSHRAEWTKDWGRRATREALANGAEFDAIFCGNDQMAAGAHEVLAEAGLRVPEDVALVGVDNWADLINHEVFLTTVDLNLQQVGRRAAARLATGQIEPGEDLVPVDLVPGPSTGAPVPPRRH